MFLRVQSSARASKFLFISTRLCAAKLQREELELSHSAADRIIFEELHRLCCNKSTIDVQTWHQIKSELKNRLYPNLYKTVDSKILRLIRDPNLSHLTDSFMGYLRQNSSNQPLSLIVLSLYMRATSNIDEILLCYDEINRRTQLLDANLCENVVFGLCKTFKWRESVDIVERHSDILTITWSTYARISRTAFENGDRECGWNMLFKTSNLSQKYGIDVTSEAVVACLKSAPDFGEVERFLEHLASLSHCVKSDVQAALFESFERFGGTCCAVELNYSGKCSNCGNHLPRPVPLNDEEFNRLRSVADPAIMLRSDVFLNTTPEELTKFRRFLESSRSFDAVLDGLNISYKLGNKTSQSERAKQLIKAIEIYRKRNSRLLMIGRKHMQRWKGLAKKMNELGVDTYWASDESEDDPFLVIAALHSGPRCRILSSDLYRDHKFRLKLTGEEHAELFRRWQLTNQDFIRGSSIKRQPPFEVRPHKHSPGHWHVPCVASVSSRQDPYAIHDSWLCLKTDIVK